MGRVETRMYKRQRKKAKALRRIVLLMLLAGVILLVWRGWPESFRTEKIGQDAPEPTASTYDQTVEKREVTLNAETWYAIQTGVFSTREAALQKADAYAERGAPGTVVQEGEKWRVFIACYGTEADAAAVRIRLADKQQVETYLYEWQCPELRLRLTGKVGQLDVVEAGFTLLISTAAALRDTATEVDAAQLTTAEAASVVTNLDSQIQLWEKTIRERFGKSIPALVEGMLSITENWDARFAEMSKAADVTALSAALKAHAMGMFDEICTWRSKVAAQ